MTCLLSPFTIHPSHFLKKHYSLITSHNFSLIQTLPSKFSLFIPPLFTNPSVTIFCFHFSSHFQSDRPKSWLPPGSHCRRRSTLTSLSQLTSVDPSFLIASIVSLCGLVLMLVLVVFITNSYTNSPLLVSCYRHTIYMMTHLPFLSFVPPSPHPT